MHGFLNREQSILNNLILPDESDEPNDWIHSRVNEIYINFIDGEIEGNCGDCSADEVADALERIALELRLTETTPSYICFDEGKFLLVYLYTSVTNVGHFQTQTGWKLVNETFHGKAFPTCPKCLLKAQVAVQIIEEMYGTLNISLNFI